jgi:hypothetical protein
MDPIILLVWAITAPQEKWPQPEPKPLARNVVLRSP